MNKILVFFKYKKRGVIISHRFGEHLVVSIEKEDDADAKTLIDGFSRVVGYNPFCKYILNCDSDTLLTYEWDKIDSEARFEELQTKTNIKDLTRLL